MSVIIKGMKMPDSCASCQFCLDGILDDDDDPCTACELIADNTPWGCGCKIIDGIDYNKERMYFCPLIPLPEHHGKLVDADRLMRVYEDRLEKVADRYGVYSSEAGILSGAMKLLMDQTDNY